MQSRIGGWDLKNKPVILRIDGNVPMKNGIILNDYRLQSCLPTLQLLLDKGAHVLLITHLGRPDGPDPHLSTAHLLPWFEQHGFTITFARDSKEAAEKLADHHLVLLENVRFFPGEKKRDCTFAQRLAKLGEYYVDDAFGTLHRADASITLIPTFFDDHHRTIGLLVEHEIEMLGTILHQPERPFSLIVGGGKITDKLPLIMCHLDHLDHLFLGPAISNTFLLAQQKEIGTSLVNTLVLPEIKNIITAAKEKGVTLHLPIDYIVAEKTYDGPLKTIDADNMKPDLCIISIGPKTAKQWGHELQQSKTIVYNGLMGTLKRPKTLENIHLLFEAIKRAPGKTIIGGGDSVAAAQYFTIGNNTTYLSTGGGATLHYLCGQALPGIEALKNGAKA